MKVQLTVALCLLAVSVRLSYQQQTSCTASNCVEPACRCMSTSPPQNLDLESTPQLVILSFDSAITKNTIQNYTSLLERRLNPNGCGISMTFFINHEFNDYNYTNYLYNLGQEIATHSMSHTTPVDDWKSKNTSMWIAEIGGMRDAAAKFANLPISNIRGSKAPFLQSSGDATFEAMQATGMAYDCSFPTAFKDPPIWPYTLDQGFQHDCRISPCPNKNYKGIWTFPMVEFTGVNGSTCANVEACIMPGSLDETYQYLLSNFERHYNSNKAPFVVSQTTNSWFLQAPYILPAMQKFLDYLVNLPDVYLVSMGKAMDWLKNPVPLSQLGLPQSPFACPRVNSQSCARRSCFYDNQTSGGRGDRVMVSCVACPDLYPWTCNSMGVDPPPTTCK